MRLPAERGEPLDARPHERRVPRVDQAVKSRAAPQHSRLEIQRRPPRTRDAASRVARSGVDPISISEIVDCATPAAAAISDCRIPRRCRRARSERPIRASSIARAWPRPLTSRLSRSRVRLPVVGGERVLAPVVRRGRARRRGCGSRRSGCCRTRCRKRRPADGVVVAATGLDRAGPGERDRRQAAVGDALPCRRRPRRRGARPR